MFLFKPVTKIVIQTQLVLKAHGEEKKIGLRLLPMLLQTNVSETVSPDFLSYPRSFGISITAFNFCGGCSAFDFVFVKRIFNRRLGGDDFDLRNRFVVWKSCV